MDLAHAPTGLSSGGAAMAPMASQPAVQSPQAATPSAPVVRPSQTPTPKSVPIVQIEPPWAHLISVNRDGSDGAAHPLSGDFVDIGSSRSVNLPFEDHYLAPTHARIERVGGGARIVPVDRLNGVYKRLREDTVVPSGAIILLGREVLRLELLRPEERDAKQLIQHGVSLFASPHRQAWGRISQLLPSGGILDVRHLFGSEMIVGREEGDVVFSDDEFLSRRHAALRWQNGSCVLADLGSSNGTFLRLTEASTLSDGDFLRLGDQMFRYKPGG